MVWLPWKQHHHLHCTYSIHPLFLFVSLSQQHANKGKETSTGAKRHMHKIKITYTDMQSNADKRPTPTLMVQGSFPTHSAHSTSAWITCRWVNKKQRKEKNVFLFGSCLIPDGGKAGWKNAAGAFGQDGKENSCSRVSVSCQGGFFCCLGRTKNSILLWIRYKKDKFSPATILHFTSAAYYATM